MKKKTIRIHTVLSPEGIKSIEKLKIKWHCETQRAVLERLLQEATEATK